MSPRFDADQDADATTGDWLRVTFNRRAISGLAILGLGRQSVDGADGCYVRLNRVCGGGLPARDPAFVSEQAAVLPRERGARIRGSGVLVFLLVFICSADFCQHIISQRDCVLHVRILEQRRALWSVLLHYVIDLVDRNVCVSDGSFLLANTANCH